MVIANNITASDMGSVLADMGVVLWTEVKAKKVRKVRKERAAKYRDENGNEWAGIGRMPKWLQEKIASGATKEKFAV